MASCQTEHPLYASGGTASVLAPSVASVHFSRHVKKHLEQDLEEQIYRCTYEDCKKEYRTSSGLKGHIDSRHLRIMFQCDIDGCGAMFYQNAGWIQHCHRVHEGVERADLLRSRINKCNERRRVDLRAKAAKGLCCVILSCPDKGMFNERQVIPVCEAPRRHGCARSCASVALNRISLHAVHGRVRESI